MDSENDDKENSLKINVEKERKEKINPKNVKMNRNYNRIIERFLLGDWRRFFDVWNESFRLEDQESYEYKVLTLELRVHFAILPIRIIHLRQNENHDSGNSPIVTQILGNVADIFNSADDEKDKSEDEKSELTADSMKQLEEFLNSDNGQKLIEELKDTSLKTLFALPYIIHPQEDESMSRIFSIDWLEELISNLDKFARDFVMEDVLKPEISDNKLSNGAVPKEHSAVQPFIIKNSNNVNSYKSKLTDISEEQISCDRIIQSAIKSKEIEDWIVNNKHDSEYSKPLSKNTQTHISGVRTGTGFILISEPHNKFSLTSPAVFTENIKQSTGYKRELDKTKSQLFSVHKHYQKLKSRFHKLHEDYQKMNDIAEVLTIALQNSVQGQPVNLDMILQSCTKIFPDRFNRDIQTDSEDTSIDLKVDLPKKLPNNKSVVIMNVNPVPPKLLDYGKIKNDLKNGDSRSKLLLLQALRQKVTITQQRDKNQIILEYVAKDLLEIQEKKLDIENTVLFYTLQKNNLDPVHYVQQSISRLLNTLASLSRGRTYLTSGPLVLNSIIKYLDSCNNSPGDAITLDMLLATLQKMSLRKEQRKYMIEANLVEWLIYHLSNENFRMGTYRLEYTCALLMNLSLHRAARLRASVIAPLFTSILTSLLSTDCVSILPYVNGALQNFLLDDEINEEAKKLHLAEILEYHSIKSGDELRTHFLHTLKIHKRECDESLSDDDEFPDDDDEIFDVLETELEEDDPVKPEIDELQGENLLAIHYSIPKNFSKDRETHTGECQMPFSQPDNFSFSESKNAILNASTKVTTASERAVPDDDLDAEIEEKKSGADIAQFPLSNETKKSSEKDEETVFLAKPKLSRTPPAASLQ